MPIPSAPIPSAPSPSGRPLYVTSAIPYVNAPPHLGHVLELVQVDTLARHARQHGRPVRALAGTDEHSLKNVRAAQAEGRSTRTLVDRNAAAFADLHQPLQLQLDDFLRTSADPRHAPGVRWLWRAWQAAGDLYRRHYHGHYCVGCEQFYDPEVLGQPRCPEHHTPLEAWSETNWFFRLARYQPLLTDAVTAGRIRIQPDQRRHEVLALLAGGLEDISVSRSVTRAHGWGVRVPGDPTQVVYVWIDALANYLTALNLHLHPSPHTHTAGQPDRTQDPTHDPGHPGPATDHDRHRGAPAGDPDHDRGRSLVGRWWNHTGTGTGTGTDRVHVIGKGILRFHAVYWPALLASAGLELPTRILVHDYLTVNGRKIAKSDPDTVIDPAALVGDHGADAVRWWLLAEVPRLGDSDFTLARLQHAYDRDLAGGIGNLTSRVTTLVWRARDGWAPPPPSPATPHTDPAAAALETVRAATATTIAARLDDYDLRGAATAVRTLVAAANRYAEATAPWELARAEAAGDATVSGQLDVSLGTLVRVCRDLAVHLTPFLPAAAGRLAGALGGQDPHGRLPQPAPVFPRRHRPAPAVAAAGSGGGSPRSRPPAGSDAASAGVSPGVAWGVG